MKSQLLQIASPSQNQKKSSMEELINRSTVGWLGTIASFSLQSVDTLASIAVAIATLVYMVVSIYKIYKELKK